MDRVGRDAGRRISLPDLLNLEGRHSMSESIAVTYRPISKPLQELINEHNYRIERIWRQQCSNAKPFKSPSTVPAAKADVSRVPAVAHGAPSLALLRT